MQEGSPPRAAVEPVEGLDSPVASQQPLALLVLFMLGGSIAALLLAPRLMPGSYNWIAHTTSESAAQGIEGAWLARLGFLLFGSAVILLTWVARVSWGTWGRLSHAVFGLMMVAAAVFAARPWDETLPFDGTEDLLHSVAAFVIGVAFALGVLAVMLRRDVRQIGRRFFDWVAIAASPLIPLAMTIRPDETGLSQRVLFGIAFAWYGVEAISSMQANSRPDTAPNPAR